MILRLDMVLNGLYHYTVALGMVWLVVVLMENVTEGLRS